MEDKKYLSNVGKTEVKKLINSLQVKKVWMQSSFFWKNKLEWHDCKRISVQDLILLFVNATQRSKRQNLGHHLAPATIPFVI